VCRCALPAARIDAAVRALKLQTEDGLISERYLIRLDHNDPAEPWFITYARGTRCIDTCASAQAVADFLNTQRTT
jgi:hypothetical protein